MTKKIIVSLIIILMFIFAVSYEGYAKPNPVGLESDEPYDIYLGGYGNGTSVIRNVEIIGMKEIGGISFLVIQVDSFSVKRSEGLIAFEDITAILPSHKVGQLQGVSNISY